LVPLLAQHHTTLSGAFRQSCLWRCRCGLALIARRINGKPQLHYAGKARTRCPHCDADLEVLRRAA
jgi:hypothetical protein